MGSSRAALRGLPAHHATRGNGRTSTGKPFRSGGRHRKGRDLADGATAHPQGPCGWRLHSLGPCSPCHGALACRVGGDLGWGPGSHHGRLGE